MEGVVLCSLILKVTPHCFCHILFVRSNSLDPVYIHIHTHTEEITPGGEYQETGPSGTILEAAYHRKVVDVRN